MKTREFNINTYPEEIISKTYSLFEISSMVGCSDNTVRTWSNNGLCYAQSKPSCFFGTFTNHPREFVCKDVLEFLKANKKIRYLCMFEKYLYDRGYIQYSKDTKWEKKS